MAKALIGYLDSDLRIQSSLASENAHLRARIRDLEGLVLKISEDNDRLVADHAVHLLEHSISEMQPA